jgi:hypothetical protein
MTAVAVAVAGSSQGGMTFRGVAVLFDKRASRKASSGSNDCSLLQQQQMQQQQQRLLGEEVVKFMKHCKSASQLLMISERQSAASSIDLTTHPLPLPPTAAAAAAGDVRAAVVGPGRGVHHLA